MGQIVYAIGNRLTQPPVLEVMHLDFFRRSLRTPFPAAILEIPNQFLLFRVYRDDRLATLLKGYDLGIDVLKLGVAVRVRSSLANLPVGLQTVSGAVQQHAIVVLKDDRRDLLKDARGLFRYSPRITYREGHTVYCCRDVEDLQSWDSYPEPVRVVQSIETTTRRERIAQKWHYQKLSHRVGLGHHVDRCRGSHAQHRLLRP